MTRVIISLHAERGVRAGWRSPKAVLAGVLTHSLGWPDGGATNLVSDAIAAVGSSASMCRSAGGCRPFRRVFAEADVCYFSLSFYAGR